MAEQTNSSQNRMTRFLKNFFTPLNMAMIGMMTALATIIYMFFPEISIVPGVEYLKIDLSDIPAIILGTVVHPIGGIFVEIFKNLIHLTRTTTMGIGELMNVGIGAVLILSMSGFLKLFAGISKKQRLHPLPYFLSTAVTVILVILAGWGLNWALTPVFYRAMGWPLEHEVLLAGIFGSTALNAVKAAINLIPFYPVIRAVEKAVRRFR